MNRSRISNRAFATSAALMLCAAASLSLVALFAKQLTTLTDFAVVVFLRFFIPFLILLWTGLILSDKKIDYSQWRTNIFRSVLTVSSQYCLLFYLLHGSLLIGTLLFTTSGLFLPFVSYVCFKAEIKIKTLLAIILSFIGVAFILNPSEGIHGLMVIGLLSGFLNACSQATMHYSSKRGSTFDVTLMMFAFSSLYTFLLVLILGKFSVLTTQLTMENNNILWITLLVLAVLTISNQSLRTKAYRHINKPASLTPFYYMTIVFSALLDWGIYHNPPQWNTYVGLCLIFIAAIGMSWRGRQPKKSTNIL